MTAYIGVGTVVIIFMVGDGFLWMVRDLHISRRGTVDAAACVTVFIGGAWQSAEVSASGEDGISLIEDKDRAFCNAKADEKVCYYCNGRKYTE